MGLHQAFLVLWQDPESKVKVSIRRYCLLFSFIQFTLDSIVPVLTPVSKLLKTEVTYSLEWNMTFHDIIICTLFEMEFNYNLLPLH